MEEETQDDKLFIVVEYRLLKPCKELKDYFKVYNILNFYSFFYLFIIIIIIFLMTNKDNHIDFI